MNLHELLLDTFYFLIASLVLVPIFRYLKLSTVLGYIISGMIIGPQGLGLIGQTDSIVELGEIGITLLLFIVGLELSPVRLKALKSHIMYLGGGQVVVTSFIAFAVSYAFGMGLTSSIVIGLALSLSSTALSLSYLTKTGQLTKGFGQVSLSVLLFQDIIIVPILAVLPLLSLDSNPVQSIDWMNLGTRGVGLVGLLGACFVAQKYLISMVKNTEDREIILASFLFFIIGMTIGMEKLGFSMSIGAFVAGLFLANSEVKNDLYRTITPFKGILMGLFFMTLGLGLDFGYVKNNLATLSQVVLSICLLKSLILAALAGLKTRRKKPSFMVSVLLLQVGEFGIVVLERATSLHILDIQTSQLLISSSLITMILSPLILRAVELILASQSEEEEEGQTTNNVVPITSSKRDVQVSKKAS